MPSIDDVVFHVDQGIMDGLRDIANIALDEGSRVIVREAKDEGSLHGSSEIREDPEKQVVWVAWTAAHAFWVRWGTKPHWAPIAPIRAWVVRNLRISVVNNERQGTIKPRVRAGTKTPREAEIDRIAYAVQAKIAKEGTEPVPWTAHGAARARREGPALVSAAISESLGRMRRRRGGG